MEAIFGHTKLILELGDLTRHRAGAIVNAANSSLMGGGGVDGAIHRVGGHAILKECKAIISQIGRLAPGKAVITTGGNLPAENVIHTVGPVWHGDPRQAARILASAYRESLMLADKMAIKTIAFPSISTGAYGYPVQAAAETAVAEVKKYLLQETYLERVTFVLFSREDLKTYAEVLEKVTETDGDFTVKY
ncbi:O-acetyl-ADP-ribose deacetylase [bacterium]|nr:O-acetyl-ADP-ribose deacetylase [bacterium]